MLYYADDNTGCLKYKILKKRYKCLSMQHYYDEEHITKFTQCYNVSNNEVSARAQVMHNHQ